MVLERKWRVFSLVAVAVFMSTLDSSIVNVSLPFIMQDLASDMGRIQWVVIVYLLTVSSLLLVFGRLSDIKGRPLVYRAGFAVFSLGSLLCVLSLNVATLVLSRAVQGVGAAMLMACSQAMIVDAFEPENRGRALGLVGACVASGLTTGPLVGGLLLEYFSWRSIFVINLPVGAAALVYARRVLDRWGDVSAEPLDILGGGLMILCTGGGILALAKFPDWGLRSPITWGSLGLSLASFAALLAHVRKVRFPLFDPALFRVRGFTLPLCAALLLFAALFCLIFLMPFYLGIALGFSPARTGIVMISPFLSLLAVSPIAGGLSDRFGSKPFCLVGLGCLAAALFMLGRISPAHGLPRILALLTLAGTGTALFISPNSTAVLGAVALNRRGLASGALATARNLGMVVGVSLGSTVFSYYFARASHGGRLDEFSPYFLPAFECAMTAGSLVAVTGLIVTLARRDTLGTGGANEG